MTFDEYIERKIWECGFLFLLERVISDYKFKVRREIDFDDYISFANDLDEKFKLYNRRWNYFVKHNIELTDSIQIGDVITFEDWGTIKKIKVQSITIEDSRIYGTIVSDDARWNGRPSCTALTYILDENRKKIRQSYLIKRNRKVYHGFNSR